MLPELPRPAGATKRRLAAGFVVADGLAMAAVEVAHVRAMSSSLGVAVWAGLPLVASLGLSAAGVRLLRSDVDGDDALRVAGWVLVGVLALAAVSGWTIFHQNVRGRQFVHAWFVLVNDTSVGGLVGFLLGWYDLRGRRRQRAIEREREAKEQERAKLEFLNRTLRHNVLNAMNVVLGRADLLADHVPPAGDEHLAAVVDRSEEVVRLVQGVRAFTGSVADADAADCRPRDLVAVLEAQVESARLAYEDAEVSADLPDEVRVLADDMLGQVFENLLSNAVHHSDRARPAVSVSVEESDGTAVVRVADDGPGVPEDLRDSLFDWNTRGADSEGSGVGLAIVDTLVRRYGGSVGVEDADSGGTVVRVELRTADGGSADGRAAADN